MPHETEEHLSYCLSRSPYGSRHKLEIPKERAQALTDAWSKLRLLADIEECWDTVVRNYIALEQALIDTALQDMVISGKDFFSFQDTRLDFALHLSNLLGSCKAYLDHVPHHLGKLEQGSDWADHRVETFKKLASAEYDSREGYRMMEELRRHAQHRGLPIHGASFSSSWVGGLKEGMLSFSASSRIDLDRLRADKKFKKSVIEPFGDKVVKAETLVRDYLEGLSAVHEQTRKDLDPTFGLARRTILEAIEEFRMGSGDDETYGLRVIALTNEDNVNWESAVFAELHEYVEQLRRKNRPMVNLTRRFVTSNVESNQISGR